VILRTDIKETSNHSKFDTFAPYQVRDKLLQESSDFRKFWIPGFPGMTFLGVALIKKPPFLIEGWGLFYDYQVFIS